MNRQDYANAINTIQIAAGLLNQIDIPEVLAAIDLADAAGPILDPTLYRDASLKLAEVRRLVAAASPLRSEYRRQLDAIGQVA